MCILFANKSFTTKIEKMFLKLFKKTTIIGKIRHKQYFLNILYFSMVNKFLQSVKMKEPSYFFLQYHF